MRMFLEVTESGDWNNDLNDYEFTPVDAPTFFAEDVIQWFQLQKDSVLIGIKGYETVFKTPISVFYDDRNPIRYIQERKL